jgi:hypothetical protein
MRTTAIILLLAVASLGFSPHASAQSIEAFTAENLRDACDNLVLAVRGISPISQEDPGAMLCLGFIAGWTQAMEENVDKPFCLPPAGTSLPGDLADLIVTYVDGHPDRATAPAHEVVLETFEDSFPCPAEEVGTSVDEEQ